MQYQECDELIGICTYEQGMILETILPYGIIPAANGIYGYCFIAKKLAIFKAILLLEIINFDTCHCNFSLQPYLQIFSKAITREKDLTF